MLVDPENTYITSVLPDLPLIWITMEISIDGYRIFVISMDMVGIHLKVEYFKQEKPLMESALWS